MRGVIHHIIPLAKKLWKSTHGLVRKLSVGFFVANLTMGIILLVAPYSWSKTIHVPEDSSTVQAGINGAEAGDTVLVADGVYTGEGNKNIDFLGKAIVVRSENGSDSSIIDCEKDGRGFFFHVGEGRGSKLEGLTVRNGLADYGGAIKCENSSPSIANCIITENMAVYDGGGIWCLTCAPCFTNCEIMENRAFRGGGIWYYGPGVILANCVIARNEATYSGGGIHNHTSFASIVNCTITGNSAEFGGGIFFTLLPMSFANFVITGNNGHVTSRAAFYSTITNCILWDDSPDEISPGSVGPSVTYSDVQGGWDGEGNIDEDPLFRDPENDDFHLMATYCGDPFDSPCIDMGHPYNIDLMSDCFHGLGMMRSDMGAYGGSNAGWPTAVEEGENEAQHIPKEFVLHQNYPNPFNSETVVSYSLPQSGRATLSVYNVLGQRVATLFEGIQETGLHNVVWNAADFSSGIYFARLEVGGHSKTVKMVLLR
ncbi:MAG: hypothetical protein AMJ92_04275 [candidate division Zixibacteria bacterium SM23_81]|nr:MAG: hypothetical protein AMJ92_04275 [candidate division Zixibacteria bacterium SM23_81]